MRGKGGIYVIVRSRYLRQTMYEGNHSFASDNHFCCCQS